MTFKLIALLVLGMWVLPAFARAQDAPVDAEGCKDSPIITRLPGSTIDACDTKEFDQLTIITGYAADGTVINKDLEGEIVRIDYSTREGTSALQVYRNVDAALRKAGFAIVYEDSPGTINARKGNTWYNLDNSGAAYTQRIVTVKEMQQEMTADASSLNDEINKTGHVAIYGIHFDTGKATIQQDSTDTLSQIVVLLQQNADLKLSVEGHTDNQGQAALNQALSEKRAQAVVAWLTAHGIDGTRLAAKGWGQMKPVGDNSTDDGRAKNRRVELVKQ
ncbi:MAG TPA: OmpA family protein [Candidatus Acidoferrum sp.]|nr:OmpA family protein [Candidatus Acidoferrum sp.]